MYCPRLLMNKKTIMILLLDLLNSAMSQFPSSCNYFDIEFAIVSMMLQIISDLDRRHSDD